MRKIAHWTPRYIFDRTAFEFYQRRNPRLPWLTPDAIACLDTLLRKSDTMVEFGSGRSTAWFASKVRALTSVEHVPAWAQRVEAMLKERQLGNVSYRLVDVSDQNDPAQADRYLAPLIEQPDGSVDVVLVDGAYRADCARASLGKLRAGGLLVIDNVNWYLPSRSRSPASRSLADGPVDSDWTAIAAAIADWRAIWMSCGVTDTAIYFKPA